MRLGVASALVDGAFVPGDVEIDPVTETIAAVGCSPAGSAGVAAPGFVDLQINGFAGVDFRDAEPGDYAVVASVLPSTGVTSILPTFYSSSIDRYCQALDTLSEVHRSPPNGTRIGGAHLEGPFLSRSWAGAHDPQRLLAPDLELARVLLAAGPIALMTLAPEQPGASELIGAMAAAGVALSMGHTDATAGQAHLAVDQGIAMATHCFNAHRRFTARDPGPAAVALTRPEVTVGLIADLHHVAADTVRLCFASAQGRVALVTDAVAPAGSSMTRWEIDGVVVTIADGMARLADGTLAGSVATMDECVRNVIGLGVEPGVALAAASTVPRKLLDGSAAGGLRVGGVADVVVLDDGWYPIRTLVAGVERFLA